jgi:hypothetical protein
LAERVLELAGAADSSTTVVGAHSLLGTVLSFVGELEAGRENLQFAIGRLSSGPLEGFTQITYFRAAAIIFPLTLFLLGYPDAALRMSREFLEQRRFSEPVWIASNLLRDTMLRQFLGEPRTVQQRAEELLSIATEHGLSYHVSQATFLRGWALANEGRG